MPTRFFEVLHENQQVIPALIPLLETFFAYFQTDQHHSDATGVYVVSSGTDLTPIIKPLHSTSENDTTKTLPAPSVCTDLESEITRDRIWLSRSEWEVVQALKEAGPDGLTVRELASKVTKWADKIPNREAVQRMVSRITCKFADHNIPFRGRSENVNPSPTSKRRRRDGRFRAYIGVITV